MEWKPREWGHARGRAPAPTFRLAAGKPGGDRIRERLSPATIHHSFNKKARGGGDKPVSKNGSVAFVEEESTSVVLFSISVCLRDFITKTV